MVGRQAAAVVRGARGGVHSRLQAGAVPHYPAFLLFNFVFFGFFTEGTTAAVGSIVSQEGIVRKTQFPRLAIPTAVVLSSLFNLLLNMIVVFVFIVVLGVSPAWTWLLFPVLVAMMCCIVLPVAMILSSLYPRFGICP